MSRESGAGGHEPSGRTSGHAEGWAKVSEQSKESNLPNNDTLAFKDCFFSFTKPEISQGLSRTVVFLPLDQEWISPRAVVEGSGCECEMPVLRVS
jgi:hypothetical protein